MGRAPLKRQEDRRELPPRLLYQGRFTVHRITTEEAEYKLAKVKMIQLGKGGLPFLATDDARTHYMVKIDLSTGKISDFIRFDTGVIAMATGGRNIGRVGVITHRQRLNGGFNIVRIKDAIDNSFATRETNVFVIGNEKPWINLPKNKGVQKRHWWSCSTRLHESLLKVKNC
ncbi:MAG: 40S ribosomal protein S4 [Alectoria sarmentosa]|nr:MAG: 40S ribosomal protein S4 [Alectoria sarmentosa]